MSAGEMEVKIGVPRPSLGDLAEMLDEFKPIAKRHGYNLVGSKTSNEPGVMNALFRYSPEEGVAPAKPEAKPKAKPKGRAKPKASAKKKAAKKK